MFETLFKYITFNWLNKYKFTYIYSIFIILYLFSIHCTSKSKFNTYLKVPFFYYWLTNMNRKSHVGFKTYTNICNNENYFKIGWIRFMVKTRGGIYKYMFCFVLFCCCWFFLCVRWSEYLVIILCNYIMSVYYR